MQALSEKEYPPQRLEDENQNSYYMNEYNRYEVESPTKSPHQESCIGKCTRWTLYLLPLIFFVVCVALLSAIIAVKVVEKSGEVDSALRALSNFNLNIQSAPLEDIQAVSSNGTCPEDYTKQLIYTWPGVYSGCICSDGSAYIGTCFARTNCPDVSATSPILTYAWEASHICTKNFSNYKYIVPGDSCSNDYSLAQSYLCIDSDSTYDPIGKVELLTYANSSAVPEDDDTDQYRTLSETNTTNGSILVLHIERSTSLSPIVGLKVELSNPPCLDPEYTPETTSGKYYPLLDITNFGCKYWGDSSTYSSAVNNETQELYNKENDLTDVLSSITSYEDYVSSKDYYKLYTVSRISLGSSQLCNTIDGSKLTSINQSSKDLLNNVAIGAALGLALSIIGFLMSICYICCRGCRLGTKYYCQARCLPVTLYVLGFVVCVILFCLVGYYYQQETNINSDVNTENYITQLINGSCFTVSGYLLAAQSVESFLSDSITTIGPMIVFLLFWALIFLVIFLICWILRSCVKKLPLFIS